MTFAGIVGILLAVVFGVGIGLRVNRHKLDNYERLKESRELRDSDTSDNFR